MIRPAHTVRIAALIGAAVLGLSACGSGTDATGGSSVPNSSGTPSAGVTGGSASAGPSSSGGGPTAVTVTLTDADGCVAAPDTVPAGVVNFTVKNVDATGITELELVAEQRIIGERENLTPGFSTTFTVRVDGGSYQIYCPGASTERRPFTVTGKAAQASPSTLTDKLRQATIEYAGYVDDQISFLLPPVQELQKAIKSGDLKAAQQAYAKARPFYEKIEPVAESFPELDPAIDLREGDVEAGTEWTGFHPIEKGLFVTKSTKGLEPLADKLVADIGRLRDEAGTLSAATKAGKTGGYQAFEIANGASGLLDEVLKSKITGEEEAYSRIDLLDFEANVEGSLQAFATLKPALGEIDPTLVPQISQKFDALLAVLNTYKDPTALGGWTPYDKLTSADKKKLTDALLAVQEPLSKVAAKVTVG